MCLSLWRCLGGWRPTIVLLRSVVGKLSLGFLVAASGPPTLTLAALEGVISPLLASKRIEHSTQHAR